MPWTPEEIINAQAVCIASLAPIIADVKPVSPLKEGDCGTPVPVARFAKGFTDDVLASTATRLDSWWTVAKVTAGGYVPADFTLDPEAWLETADEVLYRLAVAAALVFRLDGERDAVIAAYRALDASGVLTDLYQGTLPDALPGDVDPRALMLASLAARRCAEAPELAKVLEGHASARDAFAALDSALGRGLFRSELFWIMDQLAQLGVVRFADLGDFTTVPYRRVRDTLFRLGFIDQPYAADASSMVTAANAARRAAGAHRADALLVAFSQAAGCAYECPHRRQCGVPCRERLE